MESPKIVTPEFIQAVVGVVVILLAALFPQFKAEIDVIAGAVAAILIALFASQVVKAGVTQYLNYKVFAASQNAERK